VCDLQKEEKVVEENSLKKFKGEVRITGIGEENKLIA